MSKWRRAAKVDINQKDIVKSLLCFPGVSVKPGHDDILVGYQGKTYWFEIKSELATNKQGRIRASQIKKSQKKLLEEWTGHYSIVSTLNEILIEIGIVTRE